MSSTQSTSRRPMLRPAADSAADSGGYINPMYVGGVNKTPLLFLHVLCKFKENPCASKSLTPDFIKSIQCSSAHFGQHGIVTSRKNVQTDVIPCWCNFYFCTEKKKKKTKKNPQPKKNRNKDL